MFLEYYNLVEQPFGVTPDTRFLYLNRMYREALASLWYGVKESRGFMALVAQPGMGKTTLLFQLLQRLRADSARTVFLFQTCCNSLDLIRYLLQDLGILPAPDVASMHQQLNDALVREARAGKQFVFVIDEAQNLSPSVLETVRLLSDFETPQGKLLQIILAGQPQLAATLIQPEMLQLRQRISVTTSLDPLDPEEVAQYVAHRLGVAGYQGPPLFSRGGLELIARESQGIPRNINNLCFGALTLGFAQQRTKIDREIVEEVAADQNLETWKERIDIRRPTLPECARESGIPTITLSSHPARWLSRQVRRPAYLASVVGLVMLASMFLWSKKPELASHAFAWARPNTASTGPSRKPGKQAVPPEVAKPVREPHLPAVLPKSITVTVKAGDDLRHICLLYLGSYSTRIVGEIQALNPELSDPNRIEIGQEIRLPVRAPAASPERGAEPTIAALGK